MILASLCLAYCGNGLICAAMKRQRRELLPAGWERGARWLGIFGVVLLGLALLVAAQAWPLWQALVAWVFIAGSAALAVVMIVAFSSSKHWLVLAAVAGLGGIAILTA